MSVILLLLLFDFLSGLMSRLRPYVTGIMSRYRVTSNWMIQKVMSSHPQDLYGDYVCFNRSYFFLRRIRGIVKTFKNITLLGLF